jgi:hypothetical protein
VVSNLEDGSERKKGRYQIKRGKPQVVFELESIYKLHKTQKYAGHLFSAGIQ